VYPSAREFCNYFFLGYNFLNKKYLPLRLVLKPKFSDREKDIVK